MSDKTRFVLLLGLFVASLALLFVLNSAIGQDVLMHTH